METYIARQPVFDRRQQVYAYELLYRAGENRFYSSLGGDQAVSEVITGSFLLIGLENLTGGKKALINFTGNMLAKNVAALLPRESVIVKVLEESEGRDLQAACRKLKDEGYLLVVDYAGSDGKVSPLSELADIMRVDFLTAGRKEREAVRLTAATNHKVKFLADKLETREDFEQALKLGYSYFQGYFFSKPITVAGKDIPSYKLTYFRILQEINKPDMDFGRIEKLIKRDVALSYKLLKFINSLSFGFISEIRSIKQALAILGQKGITRWATLLALKSMGANKPDELLVLAVCRGKFCELAAPYVGLKDRSSDLFLLGMFSLIDAFLDRPMAVVMKELPIADDIKGALLGEEGRLRDVYELIVTYEKGDWRNFTRLASKLNLEEKKAAAFYLSSLELANRIFTRKGWEQEETDWT